ncbi:MAG: hypothetical protein F9K25_12740 [Candidatus Contendobacter sp.]|nr:MAG: hypothetical protein F9K25_12740 [Candidatus Contendobacter sp.]
MLSISAATAWATSPAWTLSLRTRLDKARHRSGSRWSNRSPGLVGDALAAGVGCCDQNFHGEGRFRGQQSSQSGTGRDFPS